MERCFSCSPFYAFFLPEKESVGKKSRHKGDCAAIRFAPIRRSFPLMYPPLDCSADSAKAELSSETLGRHYASRFLSGECTYSDLVFHAPRACTPDSLIIIGKFIFSAAIVCIPTVEVQAKKRGSASLRS